MLPRIFVLTLCLIVCFPQFAASSTLNITWDRNAESDLAGYKIYYGTLPRSQQAYPNTITVSNPATQAWSIDLGTGNYYFAMTAYDTSNNESGFSTEVMVQVSADLPGKPGTPFLLP